jgi:predicted O-methyltransferase YrrM
MYSKFQLASKWFRYYLRASNRRGHGIHSPFVYKLIREVLNDQRSFYAYEKIEAVKGKWLQDARIIQIQDLGAGSALSREVVGKVSVIAARAVSNRKFGRLLFRLAHFTHAKTIVELGTSLGVSTAYLASANLLSNVITMEGSVEIAALAAETFHELDLKNISTVTGNFEDTLATVIAENPPADLVFIDGNHRKKPVLDYFEKFLEKLSPASLIIIHDIHWSSEMEEAWKIIQQHPKVKMSIDIYTAGLVFFREEFKVKQRFIIRF